MCVVPGLHTNPGSVFNGYMQNGPCPAVPLRERCFWQLDCPASCFWQEPFPTFLPLGYPFHPYHWLAFPWFLQIYITFSKVTIEEWVESQYSQWQILVANIAVATGKWKCMCHSISRIVFRMPVMKWLLKDVLTLDKHLRQGPKKDC